MADLLSTSVSGLLAFQQALDVTSNNISNSATTGYSTETANLAEQPGQFTGAGYIGSGVDVQSVTRAYNAQLTQQVRTSQSSYSSYNTLATQAQQIDNMLSDSNTGLSASLQSFVNALQSVSTSPTSTAARQALLNQGQALAQQLQNYDGQISQYGSQLESQISTDVSQINTLAANIATLNQQIAAASVSGQTPNQLLDQRGTLIDQLSKYISVQTVAQSNGATDVYIGNGQALVSGSIAQQLTTIPGAYDPTQLDVGIKSATGGVTDLTNEMTGGELGGLLSARSQVLNPTQNALGRISVALATIVNQQQQSGMTLNGTPGQPMFTVGGVQVLPDSSNAGSASVSATRTSLSQLTPDNYRLQYTGSAWQLTDLTTGQAVTMSGGGTSANPFQAAGMSLVVSGAPSANDSFLVSPTAAATTGLSMQLTNPSQVAAAALDQATAGSGNAGTATISSVGVTNPTGYAGNTYTVTFTSATQYTVTNTTTGTSTTGTYTSGTPITVGNQQLTLTGTPAANDTFTVSPNSTANTGDNSNVLAMISGLSAKSLDGGTASVSDAATNLISQVGVLTQQAQNNATAQQGVNQAATTARSNATGVNLDQQAADMLRYQQAYQAMAQVISMSNQMFTSLIQAVG